MTAAKSGDTVRIHYTGKLTDGTEFDSSKGRDPLEFTLGAGQIISGLESGIDGMSPGDRKTVTVPADQAYGEHDPAAVQVVPRDTIPSHIDLSVGAQLGAQTGSGQTIALVVTDLTDNEVTLDANHPLAGKDLVFDVEMVEIV